MKSSIFVLLLAFLLLGAFTKAAAETQQDNNEDDITTMTFMVEYEPEEDNDIVEIKLLIEQENYKLEEALIKASALITSVTQIVDQFCREYETDKNCEEAVDVGDFDITADYEKVRRQLTFNKFIVSHEVAIKVYSTDKIGELADKLVTAGVTKIESFDWISDKQTDDEEGAIEAGQQKSHDMCFHLGMKLHRIVSVEDVEQQGQQGGDEQEQEGEDEEQDSPLVYKFEIQCILDQETAQKKAQEEAEEDKVEEQKQKKEKEEEEQQQQKKDKQSKKDKKKDKKEKKEKKK